MKVKVSEATGMVLDYLVVKSKGWLDGPGELENIADWFGLLGIAYSTDWAQAGPIIDRMSKGHFFFMENDGDCAHVAYGETPHKNSHGYGPSLLIAAMRCYANSKLGEEVEVPDELREAVQ